MSFESHICLFPLEYNLQLSQVQLEQDSARITYDLNIEFCSTNTK